MRNSRVLNSIIMIALLAIVLLSSNNVFAQRGGRGGGRMGGGDNIGQHQPNNPQLTDEQKAELQELIQTMKDDGATREEIHAAVAELFESWGLEAPAQKGGRRGTGGLIGAVADQLSEEQLAELQELVQAMRDAEATREEIHDAIAVKLTEWGIEVPERPVQQQLTDEQKAELQELIQTMKADNASREDIHAAVVELFESWGLEAPEFKGRHGRGGGHGFIHLIGNQLSDDQKAELHELVQTMRQDGATREEIHAAVLELLEQWGIEIPELPDGQEQDQPESNPDWQASLQKKGVAARNFPNPFNPTTQITYELANPGHVKVAVYNIKGQMIQTLSDSYQNAGIYNVQWNARNTSGIKVPSGTYFYRIETADNTIVQQMTLMK